LELLSGGVDEDEVLSVVEVDESELEVEVTAPPLPPRPSCRAVVPVVVRPDGVVVEPSVEPLVDVAMPEFPLVAVSEGDAVPPAAA
jgi:hypothetical protein